MRGFSVLGLRTKMLLTVALGCSICAGIAVGVAVIFNESEFRSGLVLKAETIHSRLQVAARYVAHQGGLQPMIDLMLQRYKDPQQISEGDRLLILQQVPIYAAMQVGMAESEKEQFRFRVFSDEPRQKQNLATADELVIFNRFLKDPALRQIEANSSDFVTVYRPVRLTEAQGCFKCHGDPVTSPWHNGKDVLGYPMENWPEGKLHGVFAIINDVKGAKDAQATKRTLNPTVELALFIVAGALFSLGIAFLILRSPIETLRRVAGMLSESGDQVSGSSKEIALTADQLSQATTLQASSLSETAAAIEEMSSMVKKNSDNAESAASTSDHSKSKAEEGREAVDRMMHSMDEINASNSAIMEQINRSNEQMSEIVTIINEIGTKTKVIDNIVFQTKLLSFNASVEAARAGENGKGFAVVAAEVGSLATMSGNAAQEITTLLSESISKVESIVSETKGKVEGLIEDGRVKVDQGREVARQCQELLSDLVENVAKVSSMAGEISAASLEQAQGVSEINKAVAQLEQVTQQNTSGSQASAAAADSLAQQAVRLSEVVEQLVQTVEGMQDK